MRNFMAVPCEILLLYLMLFTLCFFFLIHAVMEGTRDVTPTVLKTSTSLEGVYNKCITDC